MTALLPPPARTALPEIATWSIGAPRLLAPSPDTTDPGAHLGTHGPLPGTDLVRLLAMLDASALHGRGGAGFPLAAKLRALGANGGRRVVVNATESEPASRKDRALLRRSPHLVLDGAHAVATSIGAREVVVAVHDRRSAEVLRTAAGRRLDPLPSRVVELPGGFVAGEARAVVRALDGGPALPTGRRTPPTATGTLLSNAETFAQLAVLLRVGPQRFASTGTRDEPGTTLLTVSGAVARPGVVEVPLGVPLGIVLQAAGAGALQAVVTGGYHGTWLAPRPEIPVSRAGFTAAGASFGAGVLIAVDAGTCALGELARVAGWLADQSARQCGPCRFGLPALAADVDGLAHGRTEALGAAYAHAAAVEHRGACSHPDGAVRFVRSGLALLRDETERHRLGGCGRPVLGCLPLEATR